jgi:predicted transcriptional regulator
MSEATPKPSCVSFNAEPALVRRIDEMAAAEKRSRANWLRLQIEKITQPTEGVTA